MEETSEEIPHRLQLLEEMMVLWLTNANPAIDTYKKALFDDAKLVRGHAYKKVVEYMLRGQNREQIRSLTGRIELWALMWKSFWDSPFYGHGYFVTSRIGEVDIWGRRQNITAHNMWLQLLVSTGVIGTSLFLWALWRPLKAILCTLNSNLSTDRFAILALVVVLWYFAIASTGISFMGPVKPSYLPFFITIGIAAGRL